MRGTVKWFSNVKGFGFIIPEGGGKDIFVHHSSIQMDGYRTLSQGDKVEFELGAGPGGRPQANQVRKLDKKPSPKQPA